MTSRLPLGLSIALVAAAACGGTVVFEEDGAGGSGANNPSGGANNPSGGANNPSGGAGNPSGGAGNPSGGGTSSTTSPTTGTVDPSTTTDVTVTVVGTSGPGQSGGGFDPSSGPGGVGGADNGSANGQAVTSGSKGSCSTYIETTNQHCYLAEKCDFYVLEVECEVNGDGPYNCWCYQDGTYQGTCTEPDAGCSAYACCESFWVLPG